MYSLDPPNATKSAGRPAFWEVLLLCLILALALGLRLGDFTEPWPDREWQFLGAFFSTMARNFVEHGYMASRFAPCVDPMPPADGGCTVYMHHPPSFPLLLSVSFRVFGVHEWSARLLAIVASLIELFMIWAITRMLFGRKAALAAALLGATIPMTAFYGSFVCQNGSVLMAFSTVALFFHFRNLVRPSRRDFAVFLAALLATSMTDWHGYLLGVAVLVHLAVYRKWRSAAAVAVLAAAAISLHMLHTLWATGSISGNFGGSLTSSFAYRTWGGIIEADKTGDILPMLVNRMNRVFTWPVLLLAVVGLLRLRKAAIPYAPLVPLAAGALESLIFLEGAMRHDFWYNSLAPALIMLAGAGACAVTELLPRPRLAIAAACVLVAAVGGHAAIGTVERFGSIDDFFFKDLADVIDANTDPGDTVGTSEFPAQPLCYYARRKLIFFCRDKNLPKGGLPASLSPLDKIVLAEKKSGDFSDKRLKEALAAQYPYRTVENPKCGEVLIFDLHGERK